MTADPFAGSIDKRLVRLFAKVTKHDGEGCWEWTGYTRNGYGVFSVHDSHVYLHRLSYELHVGPVADGLFVCHHCDNKRCVRPDHLFLGTHQDNVDDMVSKGRGSSPPLLIGAANPKVTKLDETVATARQMRAAGTSQRRVAELLGVSQSTAWRWTHGDTRSVR